MQCRMMNDHAPAIMPRTLTTRMAMTRQDMPAPCETHCGLLAENVPNGDLARNLDRYPTNFEALQELPATCRTCLQSEGLADAVQGSKTLRFFGTAVAAQAVLAGLAYQVRGLLQVCMRDVAS
eukprot:3932133-Rhodomonas_salina.3